MTIINVDRPNRSKLVNILLEEGYEVLVKPVYEDVCELHIFSPDEASVYTQEDIDEMMNCEECQEDARNSLTNLENEIRRLDWKYFELLERLIHTSLYLDDTDFEEYDYLKWHWVERVSFDHEYNKNGESESKYEYLKTNCPECFTKDGKVDQEKSKEFWNYYMTRKAAEEKKHE